jgi:hypothetical protein
MNRYIAQLIQDINLAKENPRPEPDFGYSYEEFEKQMPEIENASHEASEQILGISYEELPPAEKMTVEQTQQLLEAILNSLSAKGTGVSFPGDGVPVKLAYSELRAQFRDGFFAMPGWNIDFCDGWCPGCAFADYCNTKDEIWSAEDLEAERRKKINKQNDGI